MAQAVRVTKPTTTAALTSARAGQGVSRAAAHAETVSDRESQAATQPRDQAAKARVVGRLHVDHLHGEEVPERRLVGRRRRATPGLMARHVQVGAPETPVAQQRVDVGMA
jgi:hypothetical protein